MEIQLYLINNYNAEASRTWYHESLTFRSESDAERAIEYLESIMVMNKLIENNIEK